MKKILILTMIFLLAIANVAAYMVLTVEINDDSKRLAVAERKLAEGERKLADSKSRLTHGQRMIDDGMRHIEAGEQQLEGGKQHLRFGKEKLELAKSMRFVCGFSVIFFTILFLLLLIMWRHSLFAIRKPV